jgi:hypothetical protein
MAVFAQIVLPDITDDRRVMPTIPTVRSLAVKAIGEFTAFDGR